MSKPTNLFAPWGLYAVVDPEHCAGRDPLALARAVLENGAGILQLRDKKSTPAERQRLAGELLALCREFGVPFLVNDFVLLAWRIGADGVHLGQGDLAVDEARKILGPNRLIGLSTHNREQALRGLRSGADYLGFGPMYATGTKVQEHPPLGLEQARWAAETLTLPFVAIGGITPERAADLARCGVKNVAAISALFAVGDPGAAARAFVKAVGAKG
ncbi:MAG: thiamine phosphate synthase [Candidatus Sumerlaeota bacterium]|nr:thiamine phosphate synthase [Candidatus Sumerlaeota bacterium]